MPCLSYEPISDSVANTLNKAEQEVKKATRERNNFEAALCAVLSVCESENINVIDMIDYAEAGITKKQVESWWKNHKAKDAKRREAEREAKRKEELKQKALKKLSPAERKALGI